MEGVMIAVALAAPAGYKVEPMVVTEFFTTVAAVFEVAVDSLEETDKPNGAVRFATCFAAARFADS